MEYKINKHLDSFNKKLNSKIQMDVFEYFLFF